MIILLKYLPAQVDKNARRTNIKVNQPFKLRRRKKGRPP